MRSQKEIKKTKNVYKKDGVDYYKRWTVLDPPIHIINMIREYAEKNDIEIRRAFSDMIRKASDEG